MCKSNENLFAQWADASLGEVTGGTLVPEAQLLVACGKICLTSVESDHLAQLARCKLDWELVMRMAARHAVSPLLYRSIVQHAGLFPAGIVAQLRSRFRSNLAHNLYLAHELLRVLRMLADNKLTAIAFKGPVLAATAYGDLAMRTFTDLDILVRPSELRLVRETLIADGYRPRLLDARALESGFFQCSEEAFLARDSIAIFDVHWRIVPRYFDFAGDPGRLWKRAEEIPFLGEKITTLSAPDLLLFLCIHGTKHGWPLLGWICDVAAVIRRNPSMNWAAMVAEAAALRSRRPLLLGIHLANTVFDAPVPETILALTRDDRTMMRLARAIMRRMFSGAARSDLFYEWVAPLWALESARQKIRYATDRALTPTLEDWELIQLPRRLFPLYYLVRPLRLAIEQGPRLIRSRRESASPCPTSPPAISSCGSLPSSPDGAE